MVIINQIENNKNWEYIGSDIGIAIACVMKSGKNRDITWDEDDHFCFPNALKNKQEHAPTDKSQSRVPVADDSHHHQF